MQPTAILALQFPDGSEGRMQYFAADTSDAAIQREIGRAAFARTPTSWLRVAPDYFSDRPRKPDGSPSRSQ